MQICMVFKEIRVVSTCSSVANQFWNINTICRRWRYIAAQVRTIYNIKTKTFLWSLNLGTEMTTVVELRCRSKDAEQTISGVSLSRALVDNYLPKEGLLMDGQCLINVSVCRVKKDLASFTFLFFTKFWRNSILYEYQQNQ